MIAFLMTAALAGTWTDLDANVQATRVVDAPLEVVRDQLTRLETLTWYPDRCVSELTLGEPDQGYGAPFRVRYHAGPWSRLVEGRMMDIGRRHVDLVHEGRFGFTTRYALEAVDAGTRVTMTTYLDPPVWPFRKLYYTKVRPAWVACHDALLAAIAEHLDGVVAPTPPPTPASSGDAAPAE